MIAFDSDGSIAARGSYAEVLVKDEELAREAAQEAKKLVAVDVDIEELEEAEESETTTDGKLIVKEEVAEGRVSLDAREYYLAA